MLKNKLFPRKTVQIVRCGIESDLPWSLHQQISSDLAAIKTSLNPLTVVAGAGNSNLHLFTKFMVNELPLILRDTFENLMRNFNEPNMEIVQALLKFMKDINLPNENGETPLIIATQQKQTRTVQHLIDSDANINAQDYFGNTALIFAAHNGHRKVVKDLIKANANGNSHTKGGNTALMASAYGGHIEIVQDLIKAKVNVDTQNENGDTSLIFLLVMDMQKLYKI